MSEPLSNRNPTLANHDAFIRPTFHHQFHKAHAENVARHLPRPTAVPEPVPHIGRKFHDARTHVRSSIVFGEL